MPAATPSPPQHARPPDRQERASNPRHPARVVTDLVAYLEYRLPGAEVRALLDQAGDPRPPAVVRRDATWSSRARYTRLITAAADHLGDPAELAQALPWAHAQGAAAEHLAAVRGVGSFPAAVRALAAGFGNLDPAVTLEVVSADVRSARVRLRHLPGTEPNRAVCALYRGLLAALPMPFGDPAADAVEEECQCDGAPACTIAVAVRRSSPTERQLRLLSQRADLATLQHAALNELAREIHHWHEPGRALRAVLARSLSVCAATRALIAVAGGGSWRAQVLADGIDGPEAARLAEQVLAARPSALAGSEQGPLARALVVPLTSVRGGRGALVLLDVAPRMHAAAREILSGYAYFATNVLDVESAIEEARRREEMSRSLLDLAVALSELERPQALARRVAQAVPSLLGLQRAAVFGVASDGEPELLAHHGYAGRPVAPPTPRPQGRAPAVVEAGGRWAVVAPLLVRSQTVGWLVAEADVAPPGGADAAATVVALAEGAAALVGTALSNARLLEQFGHQASHDVLTGLANRALVQERIEQARGDRRSAVAVTMIDLDGFKAVNDTYGHPAGDELLREVASRLRSQIRRGDTVGRLGGDEFVLVSQVRDEDEARATADRLLHALGRSYTLRGARVLVTVSASLGVAVAGHDHAGRPPRDAVELLRDADIALYRAKDAGKSRVVVYSDAMRDDQERTALGLELRDAVRHQQLSIRCRPVLDVDSGSTVAETVEPVWDHPERGTIETAELLPLTHECGLTLQVGRWLVAQACERLAAAAAAGERLPVVVRLSPHQLRDEAFGDDIATSLAVSGAPAGGLILEVHEQFLSSDPDIGARLARLRAMGVRIVIGDVGAGYLRLARSATLAVDGVRLHPDVVGTGDGGGLSPVVLPAMVAVFGSLGLQTLVVKPDPQGVRASGAGPGDPVRP